MRSLSYSYNNGANEYRTDLLAPKFLINRNFNKSISLQARKQHTISQNILDVIVWSGSLESSIQFKPFLHTDLVYRLCNFLSEGVKKA